MKKYTTIFFLVLSYSASEFFGYSYLFPNEFLSCIYETVFLKLGLPEILAAVYSTYSVQSLSVPIFVERKSTGELISGVLKTCKEEGWSFQACNLL